MINNFFIRLSHGACALRHTYDEYPSLRQNTTTNLMDYANGTNLYHYQWNDIHNPALVLGLFEGDGEGAYSLPCKGWFDDCDDVLKLLGKIRTTPLWFVSSRINFQSTALVGNSPTVQASACAFYATRPNPSSFATKMFEKFV